MNFWSWRGCIPRRCGRRRKFFLRPAARPGRVFPVPGRRREYVDGLARASSCARPPHPTRSTKIGAVYQFFGRNYQVRSSSRAHLSEHRKEAILRGCDVQKPKHLKSLLSRSRRAAVWRRIPGRPAHTSPPPISPRSAGAASSSRWEPTAAGALLTPRVPRSLSAAILAPSRSPALSVHTTASRTRTTPAWRPAASTRSTRRPVQVRPPRQQHKIRELLRNR